MASLSEKFERLKNYLRGLENVAITYRIVMRALMILNTSRLICRAIALAV